jgi:high-affinity iron transporter
VLAVFFLVVALERRLPHKKMLMATGVMITWVLVVLVGQTVQTMQVVGWIPVTPIDGFRPPYWAGIWLGVYPTWQGLLAQTGAAVFVVGSYLAAEALRKRRRRRVIEGVQVPEIAVSRREAEPPVLAARTSASVVSRRGA